MHNVSQLYKDTVVHAGTSWRFKAKVTLKDGTVYDLTDADIVENGMSLMSQTSQAGEFVFGGNIANSLTLTLNNYSGRYSSVDFSDAEVVIYIGLIVEQNWETGDVPEWVCVGTFDSETSKEVLNGCGVELELVDQTYRFEKEYAKSSLKYPATLRQILEDACDTCGVVLATHDFLNADYVVQEPPESGGQTSYRSIIQWVSQLAGCFVSFDEFGKMRLEWYDTESEPCASVYNPDSMWTFDVVLTGIKAKNYLTDEEISLGTGEYVIDLTDNRLIQGDCAQALENLAQKVFGFHFRPFTAEITPNPALEAGDPVVVYDSLGRASRSYAMICDYSLFGMTQIMAGSATPAKNNHYTFFPTRAAVTSAQNRTDKKIDLYDVYAKQFAAMASATVGYYTTEETLDDGSVILYSHDKPKLEDSMNIWKKTGLVVAVSNDGGKTWRGLDKDGNAILNDIAAKTIIADKIVSGRMQTQDGRFYIDLDKGESTATRLITDIKDDESFSMYLSSRDQSSATTKFPELFLSIDDIPKFRMYILDDNNGVYMGTVIDPFYRSSVGILLGKNSMSLIVPNKEVGLSAEIMRLESDGVEIAPDAKVKGNLIVEGNLNVKGSEKNRVVSTSKGEIRVSAYETAEPYFGDIGEAQTDENGQVRIDIDPLFAETVNTSCPYQVFLQPYTHDLFSVVERNETYFIVQGPPNGSFGYEIKAKQKGNETKRLEKFTG